MNNFGITLGFLLVQIFSLLLLGGCLILTIYTLVYLRRQPLPEIVRAIWAALILLVPVGGAIAFWIVQPGKQSKGLVEQPHE